MTIDPSRGRGREGDTPDRQSYTASREFARSRDLEVGFDQGRISLSEAMRTPRVGTCEEPAGGVGSIDDRDGAGGARDRTHPAVTTAKEMSTTDGRRGSSLNRSG